MESLSFLSPNPYSDTMSSSSDCGSEFMYETTPTINTTQAAASQRKSAKKSVNTFIEKLYSMLDNNTHPELISWTPSGNSFAVRNTKVFAAQVLPTHFKHNNFSSFVRLLNMYGFHKISKSPRGQRSSENEVLEFSHSHFIRGRPDLLKEVKRKTMDPEGMRRDSGDLRASLEILQLSQAELVQQFHALQETYTQVLHGLEESRKIQMYQEMQIRQLSEQQKRPLPHRRSLSSPRHPHQEGPFQMMVTTPGSSTKSPNWPQSPFPPPTPPSSDNNNTTTINTNGLPETQQQWDDFFSPLSFQTAENTPLPRSPMLLNSPDLPMDSPRGSCEDLMGSFSFSLPNTLDTTFI